MAKNILVKLGGIDCTDFLINAEKIESYGDSISTYGFKFTKNIGSLVTLDNTLTVEVWEDSNDPPTTKTFTGFLDLLEPKGGFLDLTAKDELAKLINRQVMHYYDKNVLGDPAYPDGKISDIFIDLVETYGGLSTNSGATVQDSGTETILEKFPCRNADIFERCRKLAESLNWVFYYKADTGFAYFEPKNYTTNTNVLTVGSNVVQIPDWEYDRSEMINDLRLEGAQQLVQSSEVFSGDASETEFELTAIPEDVAVYYSAAKNYATTAKLQSEILVGDILDGTSSHDYEIDKKNKKIVTTSFTATSSTNNILVDYSYYAPIPVHLSDDESQTDYNMAYQKTVTLTDAITLSDAWKRGNNILGKYKVPFKSTRLKVLWTPTLNVHVGQSIRVVDTINVPNVDQFFTIYKVIDGWPQALVEIEVGDKQYTIEEYQANIIERVKRLEETVIGSTDAVTEIVQKTMELPLVPEKTIVLIQDINDSAIYGHATNGVYGTSIYGNKITEQSSTTHEWNV